jgi:POTRA domain, ShlB-type
MAATAATASLTASGSPAAAARYLDIAQYRVEGVHLLTEGEVGKAVHRFLGPDRTTDDVEKARAGPEKAYNAKGYQTIAVGTPLRQGRRRYAERDGRQGRPADGEGFAVFLAGCDQETGAAAARQPGTEQPLRPEHHAAAERHAEP